MEIGATDGSSAPGANLKKCTLFSVAAVIIGPRLALAQEQTMDISILVEPVANDGYRAVVGNPWGLEVAAPTREEAIGKLRQLIERRVAAGAEVVAVSIGNTAHPLANFAGMLKDDPLVGLWQQAMSDYRNERDAVDDAR